jgi:hypothetical protein
MVSQIVKVLCVVLALMCNGMMHAGSMFCYARAIIIGIYSDCIPQRVAYL